MHRDGRERRRRALRPAGTVLNRQKDADALPEITADYPLKGLNRGVVHVNTRLAEGYARLDLRVEISRRK